VQFAGAVPGRDVSRQQAVKSRTNVKRPTAITRTNPQKTRLRIGKRPKFMSGMMVFSQIPGESTHLWSQRLVLYLCSCIMGVIRPLRRCSDRESKKQELKSAEVIMKRHSGWLGVKCAACKREQLKHNCSTVCEFMASLCVEAVKVLKATENN